MKVILMLWLIVSSALYAEEMRIWTQKDTNRSILAKPIDKKSDNSAIQIQTDKGRRYWIKTETLIPKDQAFVKDWVVPVEHLTIRVTGSGKGYKTIEITAKAGGHPMRVLTSPTHPARGTHEILLEKGETKTLRIKVFKNYQSIAYAGFKDEKGKVVYDREIDRESYNKKTGL